MSPAWYDHDLHDDASFAAAHLPDRDLAWFGHRARRYPLLPIDEPTASCFTRLADEQLRAGRRHDDTTHGSQRPRCAMAPPSDPGRGLQRLWLGAGRSRLTPALYGAA